MATVTATACTVGLYTTSWQDISAYVVDWKVTWGRSSVFENMRPATLQLKLLNTDRRFEPGYSSGAYYDYLKCGTLLRAKMSWTSSGGTTTVYLFYGTINSMELVYPNKRSDTGGAYAVVVASDPMAILAKERTESTYPTDTADAMVTDILGDIVWTGGTIGTGALTDPYGADLQPVGTSSGASLLSLIEQVAWAAGSVFFLGPTDTEASALLIKTRNDTAAATADFTLHSDDLTDLILGLEDDNCYSHARLTGRDNDIGEAVYDKTGGTYESMWTLAAHGMVTAQEIWFSAVGTGAEPFAVDTHYFVIKKTNDIFQLATTEANANAGTYITGTGSDSSGDWTVRVCGTLELAGRTADAQWMGERVLILSDILLWTDAEVDTRASDELSARTQMIDHLRPRRLGVLIGKGVTDLAEWIYLFPNGAEHYGEVVFDPGTGSSRTYPIKVLGGSIEGSPGRPIKVSVFTEEATQFG